MAGIRALSGYTLIETIIGALLIVLIFIAAYLTINNLITSSLNSQVDKRIKIMEKMLEFKRENIILNFKESDEFSNCRVDIYARNKNVSVFEISDMNKKRLTRVLIQAGE